MMNFEFEQVINRLSFLTGATLQTVTGVTAEDNDEYVIKYGTFVPLIGPLDIVTVRIDGVDHNLVANQSIFMECSEVELVSMKLVNASNLVTSFTGTTSPIGQGLQADAAAVLLYGTKHRKKSY